MFRAKVLLVMAALSLSCATHDKPKTAWPSVPTGCEWRQINPNDVDVLYLLQRQPVGDFDQWVRNGYCKDGEKELADIMAKYAPGAEIWWYLEESPMGVFTGYLLLNKCKVVAKARTSNKPLQRTGSAGLLHALPFGGFPLSHWLIPNHLSPAR